jgi:transcriptional regulator with XRE-family HTH domain
VSALRDDIRDFLISRRARISPEQAGLSAYGRTRRVPGLRREEVAMLAGISVEYYTQIERGNVRGVSQDVLEAISRTLQLDGPERDHLLDLVRAANATPPPNSRRPKPERIRPGVQQVLDSMTEAAAFVRNGRLDILSMNQRGYALYADAFVDPRRPVNLARFVFLEPQAKRFYANWDGIAADAAGSLRAQAGRDPYDRQLTELVGELSLLSDDFRRRWAAQTVRAYRHGSQEFEHTLIGRLTLDYEAVELPSDPGQTIVVYTAPSGSPARAKLLDLATSTDRSSI